MMSLKLEIEQFFLEKLKLIYRFDEYPFGHKTYKLHTQMINNIDEKITFLKPTTFSPYHIDNPQYNPSNDWYSVNNTNITTVLDEIYTTLQIESIYQFYILSTDKNGMISCGLRFKEKNEKLKLKSFSKEWLEDFNNTPIEDFSDINVFNAAIKRAMNKIKTKSKNIND